MSAAVGETAHGPAVLIKPGKSTGWWGMVSLIATEGTLFALLIFSYFYFEAGLREWPPPGIPLPELKPALIRSVLLLGSTFPMIMAERAMEHRGHIAKTAVWLTVTIALGTVFTISHFQESPKLFKELAPRETTYGSIFLTIINFHIGHVVIGMAILAFLLFHTLRGRFTKKRHATVKIGAMYWHFVDAIWVIVLFSLYLTPHWLKH